MASLEQLGLDDVPKAKQGSLGRKKKKIKQNKLSNLHEHVKSFTMSSSPEALLRPVPP